MSIHFISGTPGDGKTLYGVRLIIAELANGTRPIVTNVPLKMGRLNEYLQETYPKLWEREADRADSDPGMGFNLQSRIRLLTHEETSTFYLKRIVAQEFADDALIAGTNVDILPVTKQEEAAGKRPDYSIVKDDGIFYVIDEIHEFFNARAWAETGRSCLFYLAQHRRRGDDVLCITQSIGNVDKQFRSIAQDFTRIVNLGRRKMSFFRLPPLFMRRVFATPPTGQNTPMETSTFTMDIAGVASCYDTAAGAGMVGKMADKGKPKKGVNIAWAGALALVVIALFIYLPKVFGQRVLGGAVKRAASLQQSEIKVVQKTNAATVPTGLTVQPVQKVNGLVESTNVFLSGWSKDRAGIQFNLTDGRTLRLEQLQGVSPDCSFVVLNGEKIRFRRLGEHDLGNSPGRGR